MVDVEAMRRSVLILAVGGLLVAGLAQAQEVQGTGQAEPATWHRLVGILQYLESDYPAAVETRTPSELEEQATFAQEAISAARELGGPGEPFLPRLESIARRVEKAEDAAGVSRDCAELVEELVLAGGLARSPRHAPDLENGARLYTTNCAICHGADGAAQVPLAATMTPKPASFRDAERMDGITPYKSFNALSFGITGTPMPSYAGLEERERWDLAFYLFTFRQPRCDHTPPRVSLEELANARDPELVQKYGQQELACLRERMLDADEERSLLFARGSIDDALRLAKEGRSGPARQAILDAYLRGIEPIEPLLRTRDPRLVTDLEAAFARTRLAAEKGSPRVADEGRELLALIDKARRSQGNAQGAVSVFWLTLLILVREGFEVTIIVAALLAVLKKMQVPRLARVVHAGWVSALVVGGLAFLFGRKLLAGENRELMEGFFSLFAVAMLAYAALWLNARSNMSRFMGELRSRMQGALGRGSMLGLFAISFTAMLRESVETAIFLEGLSIDSATGVTWGIAAGVLALLGLVLFINRVGYRLPMKPLFKASTVLLLVTAVIMLGKGVHALQEVGMVPLRPIPFIRVDFLGLYPDAYSLVPQLLFALAPLLWFFVPRGGGHSTPRSVLPGDGAEPPQRAG